MSYKIPNRKRKLITNKLKEDFINRYINNFKVNHKIKCDFEAICSMLQCGGTFPLTEAIEYSCKRNSLTGGNKLLEYYNSLDWYDGDSFDNEFSLIIFDYYISNHDKYGREEILYNYEFFHPQEDYLLNRILLNKDFNITKEESLKLINKLTERITKRNEQEEEDFLEICKLEERIERMSKMESKNEIEKLYELVDMLEKITKEDRLILEEKIDDIKNKTEKEFRKIYFILFYICTVMMIGNFYFAYLYYIRG